MIDLSLRCLLTLIIASTVGCSRVSGVEADLSDLPDRQDIHGESGFNGVTNYYLLRHSSGINLTTSKQGHHISVILSDHGSAGNFWSSLGQLYSVQCSSASILAGGKRFSAMPDPTTYGGTCDGGESASMSKDGKFYFMFDIRDDSVDEFILRIPEITDRATGKINSLSAREIRFETTHDWRRTSIR